MVTQLELYQMASLELVLMDQHIAKTACFMLNSTPSKAPQKRTNNLEAFTSVNSRILAVSGISSTIFQKVRMVTFVHTGAVM